MAAKIVALDPTEASRLFRLEETIERGLATFVEVGQALMEIRESRLYRDSHRTFEDYCSERWQMTDRHARRMIAAAGVVAEIGPIGPVPASEAQARELAPLLDHPDQLREAWAETVQATNGKPTAAAVREVVVEVLGGDESPRAALTREQRTDRFDEVFSPARAYLARWRRRDFQFDHVFVKEARRRLRILDQLAADVDALRRDLEPRAVSASSSFGTGTDWKYHLRWKNRQEEARNDG